MPRGAIGARSLCVEPFLEGRRASPTPCVLLLLLFLPTLPSSVCLLLRFVLTKLRSVCLYAAAFEPQQPVWEHTAGVLQELDSNIKFGKVDCTDKAAHPTCHKNHVQAYPTIILFQAGATHSHAHYHGDRTTEALIAAIAEVRDKVSRAVPHPSPQVFS